jgi:hypothetical protein
MAPPVSNTATAFGIEVWVVSVKTESTIQLWICTFVLRIDGSVDVTGLALLLMFVTGTNQSPKTFTVDHWPQTQRCWNTRNAEQLLKLLVDLGVTYVTHSANAVVGVECCDSSALVTVEAPSCPIIRFLIATNSSIKANVTYQCPQQTMKKTLTLWTISSLSMSFQHSVWQVGSFCWKCLSKQKHLWLDCELNYLLFMGHHFFFKEQMTFELEDEKRKPVISKKTSECICC